MRESLIWKKCIMHANTICIYLLQYRVSPDSHPRRRNELVNHWRNDNRCDHNRAKYGDHGQRWWVVNSRVLSRVSKLWIGEAARYFRALGASERAPGEEHTSKTSYDTRAANRRRVWAGLDRRARTRRHSARAKHLYHRRAALAKLIVRFDWVPCALIHVEYRRTTLIYLQ